MTHRNWRMPRCSEPSRDGRVARAAERFHPLTAPALRCRGGRSGRRASRHSTCLRRVEPRAGLCWRLGVAMLGRSAAATSCVTGWIGRRLGTHRFWYQVSMLPQAVAGTFDLNDDGVVKQSVEQRGGNDGITKNFTPFTEAAV